MSDAYIPIKRRVVTNEVFAPARKNFQRRQLDQRGVLDTWQIDLIDLTNLSKQNDGYKYVLMVVDIFSKVGYAAPLKSKVAKEVATAMEGIFERSKCVPKNIHASLIEYM